MNTISKTEAQQQINNHSKFTIFVIIMPYFQQQRFRAAEAIRALYIILKK